MDAADAFVDELHEPTPEAIAAARLKARNQARYYEPWGNDSYRSYRRSGSGWSVAVVMVAVLMVVLALLYLS